MSVAPFPPLFVVGMHRSGMSAVAGLLAGLGVSPARWCAESTPSTLSARRFAEPRPLVWENERLLNWLDGSWACPPGRAHDVDLAPLLLSEGARSARVLIRSRRRQSVWFWNDPRLSLLLGYWGHVATHALQIPAASAPVVFVVRNPDAVVTSLRQRNGVDERHGADLWRLYNASAAALCRGRPVYIVDHDRLVTHHDEERSLLAEWLRTIGIRPVGTADGVGVDAALRRSGSSEIPLPEEQDVFAELIGLRGAHAVFPRVELPVGRQVSLRLESRRDRSRQSWERNQRVDKRVFRTARRSASIVPAVARALFQERRAAE